MAAEDHSIAYLPLPLPSFQVLILNLLLNNDYNKLLYCNVLKYYSKYN